MDGQNFLSSVRRPADTHVHQATERKMVNLYDLKLKTDFKEILSRFLIELKTDTTLIFVP